MSSSDEIKSSEKAQNADIVTKPYPPSSSEDLATPTSDDEEHIALSWRSWAVVFASCFAVFAQVFVVVGASNVLAFIIRDLGEPALVGWVIQGPLLIQAAFSPIVGRLSDVVDRRWVVSLPPLLAFVGAVISAKAQSMSTLIGGGILIGFTLSNCGLAQAITAEVLPMKYRPLSQGLNFIAGSLAGVTAVLGGGGLTNRSFDGWRGIFWCQAAFHLANTIFFLVFYNPTRPADRPKRPFKETIWAMDPIGCFLFTAASALLLLALDWAGGSYKWSDAHVAASLGVGAGLGLLFCLYEWKGRSDGLVAHVFFKGSPNFGLSIFAFAVEGWIFFSVVNSITTQLVLNLGFEDSAWRISVRQLSFNLINLFSSLPIIWYATRFKDMKVPLVVTFTSFLIVSICYSTITPSNNHAQMGYNVLSGFGQAGPLTLLVALVQFTAPHAYLANATGLAFSARAIGGAFGSAVVDVIINNKLASIYAPSVGGAAVKAGLPSSSVPALLGALAMGSPDAVAAVPGISPAIIGAAMNASHHAYAAAYRLAWASVIPFIVLALVAVICTKGVRELMTEKVDATVEHVGENEKA